MCCHTCAPCVAFCCVERACCSASMGGLSLPKGYFSSIAWKKAKIASIKFTNNNILCGKPRQSLQSSLPCPVRLNFMFTDNQPESVVCHAWRTELEPRQVSFAAPSTWLVSLCERPPSKGGCTEQSALSYNQRAVTRKLHESHLADGVIHSEWQWLSR